MNRRTFLKWIAGGIAVVGIGRLAGTLLGTRCPVTILPVPDYSRDVGRDLAEIITSDGLDLRGRSVLLKPNIVEYHPGRVINTDISLIRQVAEACLRLGAKKVMVGEAAGHRRDPVFSVQHPALRELLPKEVTCLDLNHGDVVKIPNKGGRTGYPHFFVAAPIMEADVVINMPKMKTHHWVGLTLSLKNHFGYLPGIVYGWPKNPLHVKGISNSILDLSRSLPCHYVIVDGIVGMEGDGPILGSPKPVGMLALGKHPLAVDSVCARIMGFDPFLVPYLSVAGWHLPGLADAQLEFRGEHPKRFSTQFEVMPPFKPLMGGPFW